MQSVLDPVEPPRLDSRLKVLIAGYIVPPKCAGTPSPLLHVTARYLYILTFRDNQRSAVTTRIHIFFSQPQPQIFFTSTLEHHADRESSYMTSLRAEKVGGSI